MQHKKVGSTNATLNFFSVKSSQLARLSCQKCRTPFDIFQPSVNHPQQFLAACSTCGTWFRVEIRPGDPQGVMVSLPEVTGLLNNGGSIPNHTT